MTKDWKQDEWKGCYPSSWKGMIVPEAMAHPAKFSSKLIRRIYEHMRAEGWVKTGDRVIDPFGGVALGALDAMRLGLEWLGMELEVKFVDIGGGYDCPGFTKEFFKRFWHRFERLNYKHYHICPSCAKEFHKAFYKGIIPTLEAHRFHGNVDGWDLKYGKSMPNWGSARLVQGDSRKMLEKLGRGSAALSSPPYAETDLSYKKNGLKVEGKDKYERPYMDGQSDDNYGSTPGNLGGMKGDGFDVAISSPPYQTETEGSGLNINKPATFRGVLKDGSLSMGDSEGNLGKMDSGNFAAAMISSPPYAETEVTGWNNFKSRSNSNGKEAAAIRDEDKGYQASVSSPPFLQSEGGTPEPKPGGSIDKKLYARHAAGNSAAEGYGGADGQLGNMGEGSFDQAVSSPPYAETRIAETGTPMDSMRRSKQEKYGEDYEEKMDGSNFWTAARQIVEQVYLALAPGGHAVWVCKRYVKNKEIVEFSDQWRQLCEAVGFKTIHWHRALLVHATSYTLDGGEVRKESKSFFRRLAEKKHSPRIDWEDVLCMVKE